MSLNTDAIRSVWNKYASHINRAGPNCCKGCTLARQIPTLLDEVNALRAKLDMPCGSCHPCTNWAPQTWINAGKRIPHLIDWEELVEETQQLRQELAEAHRTIALMSGGAS